MTPDSPYSWIDIGRLAASVATPIVVAVLGVLLLRRIEEVKAAVAKQSAFRTKWADEFFVTCQEFMAAIEEELAILTVFVRSKNADDSERTKTLKEIGRLNTKLSELELRIRRAVVFASENGQQVPSTAHDCVELVSALLSKGVGNVDRIIEKMNDFNIASRKAHAEMLGVDSAEQ